MYTSRISFYRHDNLEFRFCSPKWAESREALGREDLLRQLDEVDPRRCQRLVLTGGSPLEHPDFDDLLEEIARRGIRGVAVETDGKGLAGEGIVASLVERGVEAVYVYAGSPREPIHDLIMQDPGSFDAAREGLRQGLESALDCYLIVPVVRWNILDIEPLFNWSMEQGTKPKGFMLTFPQVSQVPPQARRGLLPFVQIADVASRIFQLSKYKRVEHGFMNKRGIPPCASRGKLDLFGTVFHDRFNYFKHKEQELSRVPACEECVLRNACRGVEADYVQLVGGKEFQPVDLDTAMDWKLRPMNTLESVDYHQISEFDNPDMNNDMALVRVNGHCNMACSFCFVDRTVGDFEVDKLLQHIQQIYDKGTRHLIVSGGEPTLHPQLPAILAGAREIGFKSIEMQSNGVRSADFAYAKTLADAGLTMVTISLHSIDDDLSDDITRLPKAHGKTLQALHNFRRLGLRTQIACVITKLNYKGLPDYIRTLREEFPEDGGHLSICFAIAQGISDLVFQWVIPTFTEIKPYFKDTLDYCLETGVGFGGMIGQGGYPPCMLDGDLKYYADVMDKIYKSADHDEQFYKAERCQECCFNDHCVGVRRAYINAYGDDEIRPFKAGDTVKVPV